MDSNSVLHPGRSTSIAVSNSEGYFTGAGFSDFMSRLLHLECLELYGCTGTDEQFGALILDSHISDDNTVCPRLTTLSFYDTTLPGEVLVKVVQSRAQLSGVPWENRFLRSVEARRCGSDEDHRVALERISEARGGRLALDLNLRGPRR